MTIFSVYIINKAGGLIYQHEHMGNTLIAINGIPTDGRLWDGRDITDLLQHEENYPINLKFGRPKLTTNEKIMLASMFHSLFAIGSQLSPEARSSGIEMLETDVFKLHCMQTMTGINLPFIEECSVGLFSNVYPTSSSKGCM
ncbi:TPPC4-like protein [Mya arenaria]|uniref:Trafficking protein particle complex subunit n=1 Tax=Mya arenaria TaxID=6604 RepID=A0ABY7DEV0_MYAAR|nr:TPPC4-like protein [Mya arenaria]